MPIRLVIVISIIAAVSGCKAFEGTFLPGCGAYAGDRLELSRGNFEWDKFTDAIEVDELGRAVDAFPDYPKRGTYEIDIDKLVLHFDEDGTTRTFHVHQHEGMGLQLLTDAQLAAVQGGLDEDCALTKVGRDQ